MDSQNKFDLEDRLVDFACMCLNVCDLLPSSRTGQNLEHQLSKSGTASALIYGEAQGAESRAGINLKIIMRKPVLVHEKVDIAFTEVNQLMAIFLKSIETAQQNDERRRK